MLYILHGIDRGATYFFLHWNGYLSRGGGGYPYKGLMRMCSQPGNIFRDFCLNQDIDFIIFVFINSILKSLVILAIWLALRGAIYSRIALFFALNRIFFSANENETVKQNKQSDFKVSLKKTIKFQENKRQKAIVLRILQLHVVSLPKLCCCCCLFYFKTIYKFN